MLWDLTEFSKFKIGDLVRITQKVDFALTDISIEIGEVGLIVSADPFVDEIVTFWGIDYMVLVRGHLTLLFFEDELELVESQIDEEKNKVNFIFLKN